MIHTGNEENKRKLLLSSTDIKSNFSICKTGKNEGKYHIPGNILDSKEYDVDNNKTSLDKIEHAIMLADFTSNRRFISLALPSLFSSKEEIDYEYTLSLENNWVSDIPKEFVRLKNEVSSFLFEIEEVYEKVKVSLAKTNPLESLAVINKLVKEHGLFGHDFDVHLEDLELGIREHKRKYENLKKSGAINNYLNIKKSLEEEIVKFLAPKMEVIRRTQAYQIKLEYKKEDLSDFKTYSELKDKSVISLSPEPIGSMIGISHSEAGEIAIYYFPMMFVGYKGEGWGEKIKNALNMIVSPLMSEIYFHLFPDERDVVRI